jgi:hypothetical protein
MSSTGISSLEQSIDKANTWLAEIADAAQLPELLRGVSMTAGAPARSQPPETRVAGDV